MPEFHNVTAVRPVRIRSELRIAIERQLRFSRKLKVTLEYFEKLGKAGVGFVSIQNEMDYSMPQRKFMLAMQDGLAELFSDDLSEETKKALRRGRLRVPTAAPSCSVR